MTLQPIVLEAYRNSSCRCLLRIEDGKMIEQRSHVAIYDILSSVWRLSLLRDQAMAWSKALSDWLLVLRLCNYPIIVTYKLLSSIKTLYRSKNTFMVSSQLLKTSY